MPSEEDIAFYKRVWWQPKWKKVEQFDRKTDTHLVLVRAPLTFGHSQLVIPGMEDDREAFQEAATIIPDVIDICNNILPGAARDFQELARYTRTTGRYRKLLILRTSASEIGAFKVHLAPYFQSHENECYGLFHSRHKVDTKDQGGLLAWLGKREAEVDRVEVDSPEHERERLAAYLRLPELAERFRKHVAT